MVSVMTIPGFTAYVTPFLSKHHWRSGVPAGGGHRRQGVMAQLKGGVFRGPWSGGTFGTIDDYYACMQGCDSSYSACLNSCEGTWDNPRGSTNCLICDQNHNACVAGCSRDIA